MREGSRRLLTTGNPSAASVGAKTVASAAAVHTSSWGNNASPARVPATIVSGRPTPSSRTGSADSRRSRPSLTRTVGEQHQRQGRLSQLAHELVGDLDQVQDPVADQQPQGHKHHRLGHHRGLQPPRHRTIAEQQHSGSAHWFMLLPRIRPGTGGTWYS